MRITKHRQSCLVLEKDDGGRIGIDLGAWADGPYDLDGIGPLDAVLYTHRHGDHLDIALAEDLLARGVGLHGNADVAAALAGHPVTTLTHGATHAIAGWQVEALAIPHVVMIDGSAGPPNTGLLLDGRLLHPGDGLHVEGVSPDVLALPLAGPSISLHDAYRMVRRLAPTTVLPIHYDVFPADPHRFAAACDLAEVVVLDHGQATDV